MPESDAGRDRVDGADVEAEKLLRRRRPPGLPGGRFLISPVLMSLGRSSTVERWSPTPMGEGSTPSVPAKSCLRAIRIVSCQFHSGTLVRPASRTHDACFSRPSLACRENQAHGPLAHRRKSACVARRRCGVRAPGGPRVICAASITGDALNSYFRERGSSPWRRTPRQPRHLSSAGRAAHSYWAGDPFDSGRWLPGQRDGPGFRWRGKG
jgi:hypothetical protein